jgi:hypothetical protein
MSTTVRPTGNAASPTLRAQVRDLLLEFDQSIAPGAPHAVDAARHAFRLRFALARVEELEHAAIMQSPLYNAARLEVASAILRTDIDRARVFLPSLRNKAHKAQLSLTDRDDETVERAA